MRFSVVFFYPPLTIKLYQILLEFVLDDKALSNAYK